MFKSEKNYKQSTQVAYLNCLEKGEKNLVLEGKEGPFSIRELVLASIDINDIKRLMQEDGLDYRTEKLQRIIDYSDLSSQDKQIISQFEDEILSWKIIDIHDMREQNGFYACVMETSEKDAIVGFRGSEGLEDYAGVVNDWVEADFRLLNNPKTKQMRETEKYALKLQNNHILDKYETIGVAGHSLGGNLASHFAVACANIDPIFNKIDKVCNFDGPGVSDEYLEENKEEIEKASGKITHYKWSPVGNLLYDLPGEKEVFLKTKKYEGNNGLIGKIKYYTFGKHDTRSLIFDENGTAERGEEDLLSKQLKDVSLVAEQFPEISNSIYSFVASTVGKVIYQKEDGKIGFKLPFVKVPSDDYRNRPKTFENLKLKCGDLVNGILNRVTDYTYNMKLETEAQKSFIPRNEEILAL